MGTDHQQDKDRRTEILAGIAVSLFFFLCFEMAPGQALLGLDWPVEQYYIALAVIGMIGGAYASWDFLKSKEVPFFIAIVPGMATGILMCCAGAYLVSKALPVPGRGGKFLVLLALGATLLPGTIFFIISVAVTLGLFGKEEIPSSDKSSSSSCIPIEQDSQSVDPNPPV